MAEMKEMYKLATFINSDEYEKPIQKVLNGKAAIMDCIIRYEKKSGLRDTHVDTVLEASIEHGYVRVLGDSNTGIFLDITPLKGRHFIAKKWGIPIGLVDESLKIYDSTKTLIVSVLLSGTFFSIVTLVVTYLATR